MSKKSVAYHHIGLNVSQVGVGSGARTHLYEHDSVCQYAETFQSGSTNNGRDTESTTAPIYEDPSSQKLMVSILSYIVICIYITLFVQRSNRCEASHEDVFDRAGFYVPTAVSCCAN